MPPVFVIVFQVLTIASIHVTVSEGNVLDTFRFYYDPETHIFVGQNDGECYLVQLTGSERDSVHTIRGIEDLEITMMKEWIGVFPEIEVYHSDPFLSANLLHWCQKQLIFLLKRPLNSTTLISTTTPVTPLFTAAPTTTAELLPTATSPHSMPIRSSGVSITYIESTPMKAVLVMTSHICYVYSLTDFEMTLMNANQVSFENALLSKDLSLATPYKDHDPTISQELQQHCDGTILQL